MNLTSFPNKPLMPPMGVYYLVGRTCPEQLYLSLILTANAREAVVLIPHRSGRGWDHKNQNNRLTFTHRKSKNIWGEKDDVPGLDRLLFCDSGTQARIESTFQSLGGWP
jgi:hypothetical protein